MPQRLGSENQGVVIHVAKVFGGFLPELDGLIALVRTNPAGMIRAGRVGRQITTAMRSAQLEAGNLSRVPSKMRWERQMVVSRGFPMALESQPFPLKRLFSFRRALWMNEDQHAKVLALGPERMKLRV